MATRTKKRLTRTVPPLRGPNSQVPPVKFKLGGENILEKHKKHHSVKHMSFMKTKMKKGMSFSKAHTLAQKKVGS